jgi:hypothetical protein
MQAMLFPLSAEELTAKGKEVAALELQYEKLLEEKDTKSREYNEELKRLRGQILRLAKAIDEEQELRDPTDEDAPWQGLIDQATTQAAGRHGPTRDRTGELVDEEPG